MSGGAFGSKGASRRAEEAHRLQKGLSEQQMGLFNQALPMQQQVLQFLTNRAQGAGPMQQQGGPGMMTAPTNPQGGSPTRMAAWGSRRTLPGASPAGGQVGGVNNQQMGIYGAGEDALRMAQAEEDISGFQRQQQNRLKHNLGQRGLLDSGMYAAGSGQLAEDALRQMSGFRRDLAIGAGNEQERRQMQLMQALAPMLGMGQQTGQMYGQMGNQAEQQRQSAAQSIAGLGNMFGSFLPFFLPKGPGAIK
jgi:hypothetical protein